MVFLPKSKFSQRLWIKIGAEAKKDKFFTALYLHLVLYFSLGPDLLAWSTQVGHRISQHIATAVSLLLLQRRQRLVVFGIDHLVGNAGLSSLCFRNGYGQQNWTKESVPVSVSCFDSSGMVSGTWDIQGPPESSTQLSFSDLSWKNQWIYLKNTPTITLTMLWETSKSWSIIWGVCFWSRACPNRSSSVSCYGRLRTSENM